MSFQEYIEEESPETSTSEIYKLLKYIRKETFSDETPDHFGTKNGKNVNITGSVIKSDRPKTFEKLKKIADKHGISYEEPKDHVIVVKYQGQNIIFTIGSVNKKGNSKGNPHELLTAALCLKGEIFKEVQDPEALIEDLKKYGKQVKNYDLGDLKSFENNFDDLAAAISASNKILERMKNIKTVYSVGAGEWHEDVKKFEISSTIIKKYNSSDIIIKGGKGNKDFLGISLKKKESAASADPTLVNNAINKFFSGILSEVDLKRITDAKNEFFTNVVEDHFKIKTSDLVLVYEKIKEMNKRKATKDKIKDYYLRSSDNVFFKTVSEVLDESKEDFVEKFLKTVFRVKLRDLRKFDFDFALVVGSGKDTPSGLKIDEGTYKDIETTVGVLDDLLDSGELKLERTRDKKQAFEKDAKASKVFYTIYSGDDPLVNIEIRYKGSYTSQPQFLAFITVNFKNLFRIKKIKTSSDR